MRRIKLVVSYDGTAYCGWQLQPNGVTIEEVLNQALSSLLKEDIQVIGASRTDSGVHAMGNVAVFDTESRIPGDKILFCIEPASAGRCADPGIGGGTPYLPSTQGKLRENL